MSTSSRTETHCPNERAAITKLKEALPKVAEPASVSNYAILTMVDQTNLDSIDNKLE